MKKVFILTFMMLSVVMAFAQETKKVAILEVVDREGRLSYSQKLVLRSSLAKAVTKTAGYEAYDRTDIDAIMGEQDFQRTGLVNDDQIKRLGEMTGVAYILVSEGALTGDGKIFVSAKLLNVETAKMEMTDNQMMGLSSNELQQGCEALANVLFGKESISANQNRQRNTQKTASKQTSEEPVKVKYKSSQLERIGKNEYTYMEYSMNKKEYERFLHNTCPQAYKQYHLGKQLNTGGWICFGFGPALVAIGSSVVAIGASGAGGAVLAIGCASTIGCIPLLVVGHSKQKKSVDTFNAQCKSSNPISFNLTAGQNGLGIAMNF